MVAGKSGHGRVRDSATAKGRLPFHSWFVGFVPEGPRSHERPTGCKAIDETDSELVVLAFAYDSRTKGNAATEIVKYFLPAPLRDQEGLPQLPDLLKRGNFYQSTDERRWLHGRRSEPNRRAISDWAARSVGAAWRAFDLQLAAYAALLAGDRPVDGLHEQRRARPTPLEAGHDVRPGPDVDRDRASIVFLLATAFDYQLAQDVRLAALRAPDRPARPDAGDRRAASAGPPAGSRSARCSSSSASSPRS